jgi:hypothetical protein
VSGGQLQFELTGQVTYRESGGVAVTIQRVTGAIQLVPSGATSSGGLDLTLQVPAFGTASDTYTQTFEVPADATGATWRFSASGVDTGGHSVSVQAADAQVTFPQVVVPPRAPAPSRITLVGGNNYEVYLGCWNCNEFDPESIFNQFGQHGSRFSSTSINNQFSQYGSQFSSISACNQFATRPPILVDSQRVYGELTVNTVRPYAIRDSGVLALLRGLCAD